MFSRKKDPKTCFDCQHYAEAYPLGADDVCTSPRVSAMKKYERGTLIQIHPTCDEMRADDGLCGPHAKYFEPYRRRSLLEWLFGVGKL